MRITDSYFKVFGVQAFLLHHSPAHCHFEIFTSDLPAIRNCRPVT